ncbi:hypothetical protein EGT74_03375 [Chitinophaga lutea]|uniref:Uncharacterized protein n=1 Tax=Chitinophaga lutea TaxID=2488634 RepID=A0A3N4PYV9_9BACT|nr:hypothetical protein [Chitinophaga lutea]RPE12605.1 hypothetical protein EGT74_03375 [Chitinophaga lutea]
MLKNASFSIISATVYLLAYCILLQVERLQGLAVGMFLLSPFVVCWMVYVVLKHGRYTGRELAEGEEFGYEDRG